MSQSVNGWKGFLLGALGGTAGLLAMRSYWRTVTTLAGTDPRMKTVPGHHMLDNVSLLGTQHKQEEGSTAAVGRLAYEAIGGHEPQAKETKTTLSYEVHWVYGMLQSGLYGALRGPANLPDVPGAVGFATALWILGDELVVPLLGLTAGPTKYPLDQHIHRFGAHLAYSLGATTATQLLRRLI